MSQEMIDDITQYIESRFPVGDGTNCYRSVTGEPYVVLSCGGIKPEGEMNRVLTTDMQKAVELFIAEFDKFADGKDGAIYWRRKPAPFEVSHFDELTGGFIRYYGISARLLISGAKRLPDAELREKGIFDCITKEKTCSI